MKKLETRIVEYYGAEIEIPAGHSYVATDKDGAVCSYQYEPNITVSSSRWSADEYDAEYVAHYENKDCNWQESLRHYPLNSLEEPKSERAKQFAEWFDEMFTDVDVGNPSFDHTDPYAVLAYVKEQAGKNNTEVCKAVIKHIDEYTVPQYGDYPNDNVEKWSKQYCIDMVAKYKAREGTSQRSEGNLDYWKMMHYSQLADCKPDDRAGDSMIAELLLAFKAVTSTMTPDGVLVINGLDAKGTWHGLEFDYRDWLLSGQTEMQAKLELANRIVQWVDEIKKED